MRNIGIASITAFSLLLSSCRGVDTTTSCYEQAYQYILEDTLYKDDNATYCKDMYSVSDSLNNAVGRQLLAKSRATFIRKERNLNTLDEEKLERELHRKDGKIIIAAKKSPKVYQDYIHTSVSSCCKLEFSHLDADTLFARIVNYCWDNQQQKLYDNDTTNFAGIVLPDYHYPMRYQIVYMFIFQQSHIYYVDRMMFIP